MSNKSVDSTSNSGATSANEPTSCDQSSLVIPNPTDRIKCEYCKVKGCSDTCTNGSTSGNTALVHSEDAVNTDIASKQRCDGSVQSANSTSESCNNDVEMTSDSDEFYEISSNDDTDEDSRDAQVRAGIWVL